MKVGILVGAAAVLLAAAAGWAVSAQAVRNAPGQPVVPTAPGKPERPWWDAAGNRWREPPIPCASDRAVTLGRDLDGDGDPDEIEIHLEVDEIQEEVYPGKFETFWVFAPEGAGMCSPARVPSPTIRVEEGDHVRIYLHNTHYFPHTIHFHGTVHPNAMDGVPDITQAPVVPGKTFLYEFIARNPGTSWYHCHVQPDIHVMMGLVGMFIIEPNRPHNLFRHVIPGAGRIDDLAKATAERYRREYSLVYMDIDDRLNSIPTLTKDPRTIERAMHREYDSSQRRPNIFLLNGRSFPFTLRDTPIQVKSGEHVLLRVLNAGARTLALHTHGHHPTATAIDGVTLAPASRLTRDTFTVSPAQRVDLDLYAGSDARIASGPGVWLVHDHTEPATTNNGINPGGDLTAIVYDGFTGSDGLPRVATSLKRFFDPAFYRGEVPVFDPSIFHTARGQYDATAPTADPTPTQSQRRAPPYPVRTETPGTSRPTAEEAEIAEHRLAARSCPHPRSFQRIVMREGASEARPGEVYGFEPRVIRADKCQEIEIVLENSDSIRHALMIPGLNPMFMLEFRGPGTRSAHFVTPDRDVTLDFHCHVATHEKMGMHGQLIVGEGGEPESGETTAVTGTLYEGEGVIVSLDQRKSRVVLNHKEIPGFMAPMTNMSFLVTDAALLAGLRPGESVRFIVDGDQLAIVKITPLPVR
ncbi:MAG TPA: multicopper oxidase domain-containing protein [Methylomirabilota bacterium]|nr:multicopper oxidase domain-containing protein [Methylomirabilota bacterium]